MGGETEGGMMVGESMITDLNGESLTVPDGMRGDSMLDGDGDDDEPPEGEGRQMFRNVLVG